MSYEAEKMDSLRIELRRLEELKLELKKFNDNIAVFERLAQSIEKQNELKEQELKYVYQRKVQK